ncbi:hypothetical protein TorRG33x02_038860, partial [Trema orientale]
MASDLGSLTIHAIRCVLTPCECIGASEGGFVGVPSCFGKAVLLGYIASAFSIPPIKIILSIKFRAMK